MIDGKTKIMLIEDDRDIRESVKILLESEGFFVEEAKDGTEGISKFGEDVDLLILDIMMPGKTGFEVCAEIRRSSYVPILFLTAKSGMDDKTFGFAVGADDYLVKPFSFSELSARVKALLRRCSVYNIGRPKEEGGWKECCGIKLHNTLNQVFIDEKEMVLTEKEYAILRLFVTYPKKVFTIENIYESVWKERFLNTYANTVMVHIRNLRLKIEHNPGEPKIIITVWGRGYRFGYDE